MQFNLVILGQFWSILSINLLFTKLSLSDIFTFSHGPTWAKGGEKKCCGWSPPTWRHHWPYPAGNGCLWSCCGFSHQGSFVSLVWWGSGFFCGTKLYPTSSHDARFPTARAVRLRATNPNADSSWSALRVCRAPRLDSSG